MWTSSQIHSVVENQRAFFRSGITLDPDWRIHQLKKLRSTVIAHEKKLQNALALDLGRSSAEAYFCDIGTTVLEINEIIHGTKKWAKPECHFSGLVCFPSVITKTFKLPYGVTLIISPFNFPVLLSLGVLAAAISAGNTAVIKCSSKTPACTRELQSLISETFPPEYVTVIDGGHEIADLCLEEHFDKIFYTGSPRIGKHILRAAADHLTPVALELGGETGNWCIVRKDADLEDAARKIAFFKICNSGQICININQIAIAEEIAAPFLTALKQAFQKQIGDSPITNPEYPKLVSSSAYQRCADEAEKYRDRIIWGGNGDVNLQRYSPTIIYPVALDEPIVNRELFNPLLPVVPYPDAEIDSLLRIIETREHGLALYLFTRDIPWAESVMSSMQYGGGCINEVCMQLMVRGTPFNGVGHSGMGAYHGEWGFREFSHPSTVLYGSRYFNLPLREHPYTGKAGEWKLKIIRRMEK